MEEINQETESHINALNVLVYSEDTTAKEYLTDVLKQVLDCNRYTIYPVTKQTLKSDAWRGKTALVAVTGHTEDYENSLVEYCLEGGKVFALKSNFIEKIALKLKQYKSKTENNNDQLRVHKAISDFREKVHGLITETVRDSCGFEVNMLIPETDPHLLLQTVGVTSNVTDEVDKEEPELEITRKVINEVFGLYVKNANISIHYTPGYLLTNVFDVIFVQKPGTTKLSNGLTIQLCFKGDAFNEDPSNTFLPIYRNDYPDNFNSGEYFGNLNTKCLGQMVVYSDVLTSTMDVVHDWLGNGLAVVAGRQVRARGRGGNAWITPNGQAAMSVQISDKLNAHNLPIVQHLAALSVLKSIPDSGDLDIRIKWPNDIYFGRSVKIGGIIATANCMGDEIYMNIGIGVNINNEVPTTCVNSIIKEYNRKHNTGIPSISVESFLAKFCSNLESMLNATASEHGVGTMLKEYCKEWLHDKQEVAVATKEETLTGTIIGVDEAGWLLVDTPQGNISVGYDGNTFDMTKGLIALKHNVYLKT